jgi:hypothetical protein
MFEQVKVCPECEAEFFAHIEECNGCAVKLITPEELKHIQASDDLAVAEGQGTRDEFGEMVCVDKGTPNRVTELKAMLAKKGIECEITAEDNGSPSCKGSTRLLLLAPKTAEDVSIRLIDDHWQRLHPELLDSGRLASVDNCPACGHNTGGASECQDCGLTLRIEPDEPEDDDNCGSC